MDTRMSAHAMRPPKWLNCTLHVLWHDAVHGRESAGNDLASSSGSDSGDARGQDRSMSSIEE